MKPLKYLEGEKTNWPAGGWVNLSSLSYKKNSFSSASLPRKINLILSIECLEEKLRVGSRRFNIMKEANQFRIKEFDVRNSS